MASFREEGAQLFVLHLAQPFTWGTIKQVPLPFCGADKQADSHNTMCCVLREHRGVLSKAWEPGCRRIQQDFSMEVTTWFEFWRTDGHCAGVLRPCFQDTCAPGSLPASPVVLPAALLDLLHLPLKVAVGCPRVWSLTLLSSLLSFILPKWLQPAPGLYIPPQLISSAPLSRVPWISNSIQKLAHQTRTLDSPYPHPLLFYSSPSWQMTILANPLFSCSC